MENAEGTNLEKPEDKKTWYPTTGTYITPGEWYGDPSARPYWMKNFKDKHEVKTAEEARSKALEASTSDEELEVLVMIGESVRAGGFVLEVNKSLDFKTIENLKRRGFDVRVENKNHIQETGNYYTINW